MGNTNCRVYSFPLTHEGRGGPVCPQKSTRSGLALALKNSWKLSPVGMLPVTASRNVFVMVGACAVAEEGGALTEAVGVDELVSTEVVLAVVVGARLCMMASLPHPAVRATKEASTTYCRGLIACLSVFGASRPPSSRAPRRPSGRAVPATCSTCSLKPAGHVRVIGWSYGGSKVPADALLLISVLSRTGGP